MSLESRFLMSARLEPLLGKFITAMFNFRNGDINGEELGGIVKDIGNGIKAEVEMEKPLFIPLMTKYYEAFKSGGKTEELRLYGDRWNERTCYVGRKVTLSKGYGKAERMTGVIWRFKKQHGSLFGSTYKKSILDVFRSLDIEIACISIKDLKVENNV